ESARARGYGWVLPLTVLATALSSAAILRAVGRIFFGLGTREDPLLSAQPPEEPPEEESNRPLMVTVTVLLVAVGLAASIVPGLQDRTEHAADRLHDRQAYVAQVLHGAHAKHEVPAAVLHAAKPVSLVYGGLGAAILVVATTFGLYRRRLPTGLRRAGGRLFGPPVGLLRAFHSGIAADYVVWMTVGTALIGGIWALTLR
ncbi:MAG: hypothetical protein ACJ74M_07450, partial [Gaiellaceae bacterium]